MTPDSLLHSETDEMLRKAVAELRKLLETGQECRVETVLSAFPYLASDPARALELIVLEFQLRRQLGQNPKPCDWYERFPHWSEQLRARLEESPANSAWAARETAVFATSPYDDADRQAVVKGSADVPILGRHEILEEIDRGGMGVVYRAHDMLLNRVVALKVIRSGTLASADEVRRFYREARAAARLRHPNIVPIYGMGLYERQHCFTMAFFPRGSLAQHLAEYRQDVREAVRLMVKVARAVQAAHEHGIIHRDLKPGNILLDGDGDPVVSDFGLAKHLEASATLTLPAQPLGTPAYMPPEQARGETATTASDIWSLGVILYELLTCQVPFRGSGVEEVKQKILRDDPIAPRRYCPNLHRDLVTIILTCLQKDPAQRYTTAAALADDLERWLRGEPVRARPEPRWQQLRRQFRRRVGVKGLLLLLVGLTILGVGAVGVWSIFSYHLPKVRERQRLDQVLASLQRDLAEGKSVTLVGEVGPPKWQRWRTEKNRLPLPELNNFPLELSSAKAPLLLELLPDPQLTSYRFSAEVRLLSDSNQVMSEIGLYFGCEELATPAGPEQCFRLFRLVFERSDTTAEHILFGFIERDVDELRKRHELVPSSISLARKTFRVPPLPAAKPNAEPWRRVEVRVTPVEVTGVCDGLPMGDYDIAQEERRIPQKWQLAHKGNSPLPTFPLRGGLGLYVLNGPAAFRNVVVEPIQQP